MEQDELDSSAECEFFSCILTNLVKLTTEILTQYFPTKYNMVCVE